MAENNKRAYQAPTAEKIRFCFEDRVVAVSCLNWEGKKGSNCWIEGNPGHSHRNK